MASPSGPSPRRSTSASRPYTTGNRSVTRKLSYTATEKDDVAGSKSSRNPLRPIDQNAPRTEARPKTKKELNNKAPLEIRTRSVSLCTPPLSSEQEISAARVGRSTSITDSPHGHHGHHGHHGPLDSSPEVVKFATMPQASESLLRPTPVKRQQMDKDPKKQHQSEISYHSPAISKPSISESPFSHYRSSRQKDTMNSSFHSCTPVSSPEKKAVDQHGYHTEEEEKELSDCFQQKVEMSLVSMLLIGPPRAGKSSLMRNLIEDASESDTSEESPLSKPHPPISEPHPPTSESSILRSEPHPHSSETVFIKKVDSRFVMINEEGEWKVLDGLQCPTDCYSSRGNILTGTNEVTQESNNCTVAILNIIDVGSQPEFHETLSVLINGPAFPVIVFNATENLKDQRTLMYQYNSDCNSNVYKTQMTTEDTIIFSLSTIASSKQIATSMRKDLECPSPTILVGTNRRSSKDVRFSTREVDQLVSVELERDCPIVAPEKDTLVFEVDNKEDHAGRFSQLRDFIKDIVHKHFKPSLIPCLWLALYSLLQASKKSILQLSECQKLTEGLGMHVHDLPKALEVFHSVGFIMHFPSCNELKDLVIKDIQVVLDGITALIKDTFSFENRALSRPLVNNFQKKGLFALSDVKRAYVVESRQSLTASQLVALLQLRHIVVEIPSKEMYFMPCVLPSTKLELPTRELLDSSSPSPLLVQLSCGYHSAAFTCNLIAQLISKWNITDCALNRNKFSFRAGKNEDLVRLMCWPKYYEVQFTAQLVRADNESENVACEQVCEELQEAISKVSELLAMDCKGKHKLGFYCHCGDGGEIHDVFFGENGIGCVIMCKGVNKKLTPAQLMWLRNHVNQPSISPAFKDLTLADFQNDVAASIPARWRAVGIQLGLPTGTLDGIQLKADNDYNAAYEGVFASCPTCTWDRVIKALESPAVGENKLACQLKEKYSK